MSCIIQVVGKKDVGKTSVIERAIPIIKSMGYTIGVIKHSHHELDLQGKDTYRFWNAGADIVSFLDSKCTLFFKADVKDIVNLFPVDVVIIEGFKELNLTDKRIEVSNVEEDVKRLISLIKECRKLNGVKLISNLGELNINDVKVRLLYNLLNTLNIREVKIASIS